MSKIQKTDHFYLIDGSGYIFRAYYALPPLTRKSDGMPTGAVSGFCSMLFKLLEDSKSKENLQKPSHFAVIFDSARKNFRNEIYSDYKGNRSDAPDDLIPQFEFIRKSVLAFNLPSIEMLNYEADDLIATYVEQILEIGAKVTIVSSDKDLMQLYKKGVRIYDPMKNKFITEDDVHNKFGVTADKVIDVQSLAGDSSDNVPGVPGIGVKTAAELINKYGNLEKLLEKADEIKQNKRRETILENKEIIIVNTFGEMQKYFYFAKSVLHYKESMSCYDVFLPIFSYCRIMLRSAFIWCRIKQEVFSIRVLRRCRNVVGSA